MENGINKLIKAIEHMENLYEVHDPNNVDSLGMLNFSINSNELILQTAKEADHNKNQMDVLEALERRIETVKSKVNFNI